MSILSDITIAELCGVDVSGIEQSIDARMEAHTIREQQRRLQCIERNKNNPMIDPFCPEAVRKVGEDKIVSWGLSGYGYDVRLGSDFKIFTNVRNSIIDPLNPDPGCYHEHSGDFCIIPPNSYILGHSIETFSIPRDIMTICLGKSTYARLGAIVNVTPIEPGFKGQVVIEISNATNLPLKVYANMGVSQFLFFRGDRPCKVSYADKGGKYQGQTGVQIAKL